MVVHICGVEFSFSRRGKHTGLVLGQDWIPLIKKCRAAVMRPGKTKSMEMLVLLYSCRHKQTSGCLSLCCVQEASVDEARSLSSRKGSKARAQAQGSPSAYALSSGQQLGRRAAPCPPGRRARLEGLRAAEPAECSAI